MPASPDVFRALGALCEPPDPAHAGLAAALGLPVPPDAATWRGPAGPGPPSADVASFQRPMWWLQATTPGRMPSVTHALTTK